MNACMHDASQKNKSTQITQFLV